MVFSSGTTGLPKALRHSHRTMYAATRHWVDALGLSSEDRLQIATPPFHILGLLNLLAVVSSGASVRLHRRFDLDTVLQSIEGDRITIDGGGADRPCDGVAPRARALRSIVAALHHVGRHAGDCIRRRDRHPPPESASWRRTARARFR